MRDLKLGDLKIDQPVSGSGGELNPEQGFDAATLGSHVFSVNPTEIDNQTGGLLSETVSSVHSIPSNDTSLRYAELNPTFVDDSDPNNTSGMGIGISEPSYIGASASSCGLWTSGKFWTNGAAGIDIGSYSVNAITGVFKKGRDIWIAYIIPGVSTTIIGGGDPYTGTAPTITLPVGTYYLMGNCYGDDNQIEINTVGNFLSPPSSPAIAWDS